MLVFLILVMNIINGNKQKHYTMALKTFFRYCAAIILNVYSTNSVCLLVTKNFFVNVQLSKAAIFSCRTTTSTL